MTLFAWAGLIGSRISAEHRTIPVNVVVDGPPPGFAARFPGVPTNGWVHHISYEQISRPSISRGDIAAIKRCLAWGKFLPLFPSEIEIGKDEVTARYGMKINQRTGRVRERIITFARDKDLWRIERIRESAGTADFARPPTLWEKFLSYLPFTD